MIYNYEIMTYLAKRLAASDVYNLLGLKQCAVTSPINPLPSGSPKDIMPCITLAAGEPMQFDPPDELTQETTYNIRLTYYRPIYANDNIVEVMSRELKQIAEEVDSWHNLDWLQLGTSSAQQLYFSGQQEDIAGWFEKEKLDDNDAWALAVWGYFNLQIKVVNNLTV